MKRTIWFISGIGKPDINIFDPFPVLDFGITTIALGQDSEGYLRGSFAVLFANLSKDRMGTARSCLLQTV